MHLWIKEETFRILFLLRWVAFCIQKKWLIWLELPRLMIESLFLMEKFYYSTAHSESFLFNSQVHDQDRCLYSKSDSANLQRFLAKEMSSVPEVKRLCVDHRASCEACNILNKANHPQQSELMSQIWNNLTTTQNEDGTRQIHHE